MQIISIDSLGAALDICPDTLGSAETHDRKEGGSLSHPAYRKGQCDCLDNRHGDNHHGDYHYGTDFHGDNRHGDHCCSLS